MYCMISVHIFVVYLPRTILQRERDVYAMYAGSRGFEASVPLENSSGQFTFFKLD